MAKRVKKEEPKQGRIESSEAPPAALFDQLWPEIAWQLQSHSWGNNGGPREPGGLSIFPQDGLWKVALRERNLGQVVFLTGRTVHEALTRLDSCLREHTVVWREDRYASKRSPGA